MNIESELILLFGMPRSGTTWLGKIFDSHPDTYYLHEPDSKVKLDPLPLVTDKELAKTYYNTVNKYINSLLDMRSAKVLSKLPVFRKSYYNRFQFDIRYFNIMLAKAATKTLSEFPIYQLKNLRNVRQLRPVWKSIESSGRIGVIATMFPESNCIYLIRHPCGYVASIKKGEGKGKFESNTKSSEDYGVYQELMKTPLAKQKNLNYDRIKSMQPIERLALRWLLFNENVLMDIEECRNIFIVRYEDVCEKPVDCVKSIFEKVGLSWSDQTKNFIEHSTSEDNASYYAVIKNPKLAAEKWKTELSNREVSQIQDVVKGTRSAKLFDIA